MSEFQNGLDMLAGVNVPSLAKIIDPRRIGVTKKKTTGRPKRGTGIVGITALTASDSSDSNDEARKKYLSRVKSLGEKYGSLDLSAEQVSKVKAQMNHLSTGVNSVVPMMCEAGDCSFARTCPYQQIGRAPIGEDCIVETQLIAYWTEQFITEFDVNMNNHTEVYLVAELAEFNIYEMRITKYLSQHHPTLMQKVTMAVAQDGSEIVNTEISRAFDLKERIKKSRLKVLESLNATRKERSKIVGNVVAKATTTGQQISELKAKLEEYMGDISKQKVLDADLVDT